MEAFKVQKPGDWNQIIQTLPDAHVLQTWQWSQIKAPLGWQPLPAVWRGPGGQIEAAAMILQRAMVLPGLPLRLNMLYIPRGPLLDWSNGALVERILDNLQAYTRQNKSIFLKIDPDVCVATGPPDEHEPSASPGKNLIASLERRGWIFSNDQVQFRNTVLIDLEASEEDILARMRQKTRYNIHLAERKGVTIRTGAINDLPMLYKMYAETSVRDGFVIRDQTYYSNVWQSFLKEGLAEILIAEVEGSAVAGIILFRFGAKAWYLYGMSRNLHREKMPNYLLQWEAIRRLKSTGGRIYDLWGAPDNFVETDSMWGVYKFKEGLGGTVLRTPGAWDYPARPSFYRLYTQTLPYLLEIMRRRGKDRARRDSA
ncbi:MAG TPA: peptidoglycan bridge formation glycyltransferase FemA/FemB family protein [Anaerolineaceae bacterium]